MARLASLDAPDVVALQEGPLWALGWLERLVYRLCGVKPDEEMGWRVYAVTMLLFNFAGMLAEDLAVREFLKKRLKSAAVSRILIERPAKNARITIYSARPGVVIGKKGEDIENLKAELTRRLGVPVAVNIEEVRKPEIDAQLIADSITQQLEKRIMFRRAMKRAVQSALRLGAEGIRITCAGRLGGAEIARTEWYRDGRVPLHTLRGNVAYAAAEAHTAYGVCGVKVWVFKGEILGHDPLAQDRLMMEAQTSGVRPAREERNR